eukprot:5693731-Pleurochrysis_carterae.AAC.1
MLRLLVINWGWVAIRITAMLVMTAVCLCLHVLVRGMWLLMSGWSQPGLLWLLKMRRLLGDIS